MKLLFKILLFNFLFGVIPNSFIVNDVNSLIYNNRDVANNLADDSIVDLREGYNNNAIYVLK